MFFTTYNNTVKVIGEIPQDKKHEGSGNHVKKFRLSKPLYLKVKPKVNTCKNVGNKSSLHIKIICEDKYGVELNL